MNQQLQSLVPTLLCKDLQVEFQDFLEVANAFQIYRVTVILKNMCHLECYIFSRFPFLSKKETKYVLNFSNLYLVKITLLFFFFKLFSVMKFKPLLHDLWLCLTYFSSKLVCKLMYIPMTLMLMHDIKSEQEGRLFNEFQLI